MLIDLSHEINESTPVFPGDNPVRLKKTKHLCVDGYNSFTLCASFHIGTHIDMPMHMLDDGRTAADFSVADFCKNGVLLDVRGQNVINATASIAKGDAVLLFTDHSKFFGKPEYFSDFPILDSDFADYLIQKQVSMVGLDTPSPDRMPFEIHKKLLANGIFIVENLTNLKALMPAKRFTFIAFPLKIKAEASFVRAVAKVEQ